MDITDRLLELDNGLKKHNEGEWSNTVSEYSAFNDAGVECEVGEFLYSLVRILKPTAVLETGSHVGVGASYLGMGLKDNGKGFLETVEFLPELHKQAVERIKRMGLEDWVTLHLQDVKDFNPNCQYDLLFLDTEPQTRFNELVRFYDYVKDGGFIFIHDLPRNMCQGNVNTDWPDFESWPFGNLPGVIKEWLDAGSLVKFHFPTPRGLVGFYKVREDDYKT